MSDRTRRPPSDDDAPARHTTRVGAGPTTREGRGPTDGATPAAGKVSLVQRRHSTMPARAEVDAAPPAPSVASASPMPTAVFDAFALHLDPVQRATEAAGLGLDNAAAIHAHAARGVAGAPSALPYGDQLQRSFGVAYDLSTVGAHIGGPAADAAAAMGAAAYATGDRIAFAREPDLHTAAHEAAHVVQQRAGVSLKGGVGAEGDPYERHADAVADAVVRGESAAALLAAGPGGGSSTAPGVQRKGEGEPHLAPLDLTASPSARASAALQEAAARARVLELRTASAGVVPMLATMMAVHVRAGAEAARTLAEPGSGANARDLQGAAVQLTKLARSGMSVMRRLGTEGGPIVAAALAELGQAATPLGWQLPASTEDAAARAQDDEPCEADAAMGLDPRTENPDACFLSEPQRDTAHLAVANAVGAVRKHAAAVLATHRERLEAAIKKDQRLAATIVELTIDALVTAATAGLGKGAGAAAGKAAGEASTSGLSKAVREVSRKVAIDSVKSIAKKSAVQDASTDNNKRLQTIALTGAMGAAADAQLDDLTADLAGLDDHELAELAAALRQVTPEKLEARIGPIVAAFEQQLAPIGDVRLDADALRTDPTTRLMPRQLTKKAVRVGSITPPVYALVEVAEDVWPGLRRAGRATVAHGGRLADPASAMKSPDLLDGMRDAHAQVWINTPDVSIRFLTWIDSPPGADFEAAVSDDAPTVAADRIVGLPLFTPKGTPAR